MLMLEKGSSEFYFFRCVVFKIVLFKIIKHWSISYRQKIFIASHFSAPSIEKRAEFG